MHYQKTIFREVIRPQSHRLTSLLLDLVAAATVENFLLLLSGLFDELEYAKLHIPSMQMYRCTLGFRLLSLFSKGPLVYGALPSQY